MTEDIGEGLGAISGSHASTEPAARLGPSGFDPARLLHCLKRIEAVAIKPGKYSGPAFDEIAALASSCIASIERI